MTTILVILYCVVAFLVDHATMREWKDDKLLGTAPQDIIEREKLFRCGVFVGAAFWPITAIFAIIKVWRKK
jgi:hypothetical protein